MEPAGWIWYSKTMANYSTMPRTPLELELDRALHLTLDRAEAAETEVKRLQGQLKAMFEGNVGIGVLQEIALDPTVEPSLRLKAATALSQTEKPRLSAVMTTAAPPVRLYDVLERKRLEALEQRSQPPKTTAPPLASDRGGEALEPDPAA
jgi:hypothetical protein